MHLCSPSHKQTLFVCAGTALWIVASGIILVFAVPIHALMENIILYGLIFPVLINACIYGQRGGLLTALAASFLAGSRIFASPLSISSASIQHLLFQIVFFNIVALVTSILSDQRKANERKYKELFNDMPIGLYRADTDGRLLDANDAFASLTGYKNVAHLYASQKKITDFFDTDADFMLFTTALMGPQHFFDHEQVWKSLQDNQKCWVRHIGMETTLPETGDTFWKGSVLDLTAHKKMADANRHLEEQLQQAQKMQALGTLTSGIAHDFNNLLQSALGYTQSILRINDIPLQYRENITRVECILEKSASLVRRILSFSRKTPLTLGRVDMNAVINEILPIILSGAPNNIDVSLSLDESAGTISGDMAQLEQVLLNLASNAMDAMPNGGILSIKTKRVPQDKKTSSPEQGQTDGVQVSISDTGMGMTEETRRRIFEPFYTTKPLEHGTGLGLSLVYGIINAHKGTITCSSKIGTGSKFCLFFPLCSDGDMLEHKPAADLPRVENEHQKLRILIVDDEEMIRETVQEGLEMLGHDVVPASGGKDGLELLLKNTFDAVVLDLGMPEMSGEECLKKIHQLYLQKKPKIIVASGFINTTLAQTPHLFGADAFLPKPYKIEALQITLRNVMDGTQTATP